ncbi:unnamed protein product [Lactuca saligna]|uniref:Uncharacterized protein n=1 Tax=Lactuca saligna TaxID=75948 RepID=A0AA35ZYB0_LACSI|nr:unnamed protein product [Lactuca saligna]
MYTKVFIILLALLLPRPCTFSFHHQLLISNETQLDYTLILIRWILRQLEPRRLSLPPPTTIYAAAPLMLYSNLKGSLTMHPNWSLKCLNHVLRNNLLKLRVVFLRHQSLARILEISSPSFNFANNVLYQRWIRIEVEVSVNDFPYYLRDNTKIVLIAASYIHLKHKDQLIYVSELPIVNPRILLSGPACIS